MLTQFSHYKTMPSQKKSINQKNKKWRKQCVDAGEETVVWQNGALRKTHRNKVINYNLYSDILDQSDIERTCNPHKIMGMTAPAKMQNYPIANPKIDLLMGEAIKRKFDYKVVVNDYDAVSKKEEALKEELYALMTSHINQREMEQEQIQKELAKFQDFRDYEYQDHKERLATQILSYHHKNLNLDNLFGKGFKDALLVAEEIYQADVVGGEPILRRLNPKNVFTVRSGESNLIEDSDIIVIRGYLSPGQIIDQYHDFLSDAEVNRIENGMAAQQLDKGINIGNTPELQLKLDDSISLAVLEGDLDYSAPMDEDGNILVTKVYWKSMLKIQEIKRYDEDGDVEYELYDEFYKPDKSKGEESKTIWVSEWWEGHKIGGGIGSDSTEEGIYTRMRPKPMQFRSLENPSKCHPGIVGTIYNTNDNLGVSLMDRMKPYQYLYNVLAYNAELAIAKHKGKIMRMDLSEVPEGWKIDKWLAFAESMNIAFTDSFKEGNKGAAQGKLAGSMQRSSPVIDMEMGNTINLYISMMEFIKQEIGEISGVSRARQGQIHNREAVGNVEREVVQSSHITEYWFSEHEWTMKRALEALLHVTKYAWKDVKNKKVQYILDDGAQEIMTINGEDIIDADFGIQITSNNATRKLAQSMEQLAHAGMQNGLTTFSDLIDILSTDSLSAMRRKIERSEKDKVERDQKNQEQQERIAKSNLQAEAQKREEERQFKREEWEHEKEKERIKIQGKLQEKILEFQENNSEQEEEITLEKLKQEAEKIEKSYSLNKEAQEETERHNRATEKLDEKKLSIQRKQKTQQNTK